MRLALAEIVEVGEELWEADGGCFGSVDLGVACGAESTGRLGAGLIDPKEARRLLGEVEVGAVELPVEVS